MSRIRWPGLALLMLLILSLARPPTGIVQAQGGGVLTYGANTMGSITPQAPLLLYSFSGSAGDLVRLDAGRLSGDLQPVVDLLAPNRQTLASSRSATLASNPQDTTIALILPETGVYSLMVGGLNGSTGDFVLQLQGRPAATATPLIFGQAVQVSLTPSAAPQYFTFIAEECPTTLVVFDLTAGQPYTYPFQAVVRDERGQEVARLRGGEALEDRVTVAPLSGTYEVEVWADEAPQTGTLSLLVTCEGDAPSCLANNFSLAEGPSTCPTCCETDRDRDPGLCGAFVISLESSDDGSITFSWPVVEGQDAVIWEIGDAIGSLVAARMVETSMGTSEHVDLLALAGPGSYTLIVNASSETEGVLCQDRTTVEVGRDGPVHWGPAAACDIHLVAPLDTMANGLQTFFWSDVEGAESYSLTLRNGEGTVVATGGISAPSTSMTLDASVASIGPGTFFDVSIAAIQPGGGVWCSDSARLERGGA